MNSSLPQGWKEKELGSISLLGDGAHSKIKRLDTGVLYLTSKNIKKGYLDLSKVDYISKENYSKYFDTSSNSIKGLKTNDILVGIIGSFGTFYLYKYNDNFGISSSIGIIRANKNLVKAKYLMYIISSKYFNKTIEKLKGGSVQGYTNLPTLKKVLIPIPPLNEQKRIADILSAFDDKIELNNQMNQTLEDMATTLFKEWFENFNFPNEQGKPYKDNDGEMKSSELGDIPVDWEVKYLKEISETISKGTTPKKNEVDGLDSNVYFLKVKDINNDGTIEFSSLEKIPMEVHQKQLKRSILKTDDILVSIAGTIGRTSIVPSSLDDSNCNQAIAFIRLKNKNVFKKFIYQWIRTLEAQNRIQSGIVQGVQANVSLTTLGDLKIILPSDLIMNKFNSLINPIFEQIQQNQQQNQTLKKQRDTLLPKLMSGEIRV